MAKVLLTNMTMYNSDLLYDMADAIVHERADPVRVEVVNVKNTASIDNMAWDHLRRPRGYVRINRQDDLLMGKDTSWRVGVVLPRHLTKECSPMEHLIVMEGLAPEELTFQIMLRMCLIDFNFELPRGQRTCTPWMAHHRKVREWMNARKEAGKTVRLQFDT